MGPADPPSSGARAEIGRDGIRLRRLPTAALTAAELAHIRALMDAAFEGDEDDRFSDDDWQHALGGVHVLLDRDGQLLSHASVVEREIHVDGVPLRTGYVEAVATAPGQQGVGYGSLVISDVTAFVRERYAFGVLGTGRKRFYERLGWITWAGPLFVRTADGPRRTPEDEGFLLVLLTPTTPPIDIHAPISCDWRPGDVW